MSIDGSTPENDVTVLLRQAAHGEAGAWDRAFQILYNELRRIAARQLGSERPGHTLQPTALVNEAYLKLGGGSPDGPADRAHFVSLAARAMRQVLVDHARARGAVKRGGGLRQVTLEANLAPDSSDPVEILALNRALDRLDEVDPRLRQVVELRYFGGLKDEEIGALLGVTRRTTHRYWVRARAWLHRELATDDSEAEP